MREKVKVNWKAARWVGQWYTVRPNYWSAEMSQLQTVAGAPRNSDPLPGQDTGRPWWDYSWMPFYDLSFGDELDGWRLTLNGHHYTIYND